MLHSFLKWIQSKIIIDDSDYIWYEKKEKITFADPHEFPWTAIIAKESEKPKDKYCGATLVSPWLLVSAKSCAPKSKESEKNTWALLGVHNWPKKDIPCQYYPRIKVAGYEYATEKQGLNKKTYSNAQLKIYIVFLHFFLQGKLMLNVKMIS